MDFIAKSQVEPSGVSNVMYAEPDDLAAISSATAENTSTIGEIVTSINSLIESTGDGTWTGTDADTFRSAAAEVKAALESFNAEIATIGVKTGQAGETIASTVEDNASKMANI